MTPEESEYVQRVIAGIIDLPSLYMGGPSADSMRKAAAIMDTLDASYRLIPTACTHDAWDDTIGTSCPTCGMIMNKSDLPEFMFKAEK